MNNEGCKKTMTSIIIKIVLDLFLILAKKNHVQDLNI